MIENKRAADQIEVVFYTDPLCCWSAALQQHIDKLKEELSGKLSFRYCMAGMIPSWQTFKDPMNSIDKPSQMGPVWMEARHITGADIDDQVWVKDPPASSLPACIAVKAAELQSVEAGEKMLFALRDAVMKHSLNIAKDAVLSEVADKLGEKHPEIFDATRFKKDYNQTASRNKLREDLNEIKIHKIGRFPTMLIRKDGYKTLMITGYRPYDVLISAFSHFN